MSKMKSDVVSRPLDEVEALIGVNVPEKIEVLPPKPSHTKGSGKRIKGGKEKAMEHAQRSLRQCQTYISYVLYLSVVHYAAPSAVDGFGYVIFELRTSSAIAGMRDHQPVLASFVNYPTQSRFCFAKLPR
ncbi:FAR1-related protein [Trifolium pratense]|uniref:FAR1-related protein n=1 Tax=Trifolium pratense TaxID=57577 RepID=A0A2K3M3L6_TRIPR|nr:FAR1-related protein [Trifolium pratense]